MYYDEEGPLTNTPSPAEQECRDLIVAAAAEPEWLALDPSAPDAGWMAGDWVNVRSPGNPPVPACVTRTRVHDAGKRAWVTGSVWHGTMGRLMFIPTEWQPL